MRKALQLTLAGTHRVGIAVAVGIQQVSGHFHTPTFRPSVFAPSGLYYARAKQGNVGTEGCTLLSTSAAAHAPPGGLRNRAFSGTALPQTLGELQYTHILLCFL